MFERLKAGFDPEFDQIKLHLSHISEYERGIREPPLRVLLEYARIGRLPMEVLVDPQLLIPYELSLSLIVDRIRELGPKTFWALARRAQAGEKITKLQKPDKRPSKRGKPNKPK
jgi:transcriptional regulator with XRE-family HTH domain